MDRRTFFRRGIIGGVAAAAAAAAVREWPFRVFSFPSEVAKPQIGSVRFIRAFDPIQGRMVNRWDVLYGFGGLRSPQSVENCHVVNIASSVELEEFIDYHPESKQLDSYLKQKLSEPEPPGTQRTVEIADDGFSSWARNTKEATDLVPLSVTCVQLPLNDTEILVGSSQIRIPMKVRLG